MISCLASDRSRTISDERPFEDVVLETLELEPGLAQHRERGVDAGVDDLVEQVARSLREDLLAQIGLLAVALEHRRQRRQRDVRQRDQEVRTQEQVDLRGQDPAGVLVVQREVQDDEDVVRVLVELGTLVARVDILDVELVELRVVVLEPVAIRTARRFDVDPAQAGCLDDLGIRDGIGQHGILRAARTAAGSGQRTGKREVRHVPIVEHRARATRGASWRTVRSPDPGCRPHGDP